MSAFALALERGRWDLAALYLLIGACRTAAALPPEAVEALLDLLGGGEAEAAGG